MKHHACVAIGINQYNFLQPLSYAQKDAEAIQEFLVNEGGFSPEKSLLMTDNSPQVFGLSTEPNRKNILDWVDSVCQEQLSEGELLWFFWSGYGFSKEGQDYLLPIDGNPTQLETTGIPVKTLFEHLKGAPTQNIVVLLDMNRSQGAYAGESVGNQTIELARELEIPTLLSCRPEQLSRETSALRQGFFTVALLEGLKSGECKTLDDLTHFLSQRLPELTEQHLRPRQKPVFAIYPAAKMQQVILPDSRQMATATLNNGMMTAESMATESYRNGTVPPQAAMQLSNAPNSSEVKASVQPATVSEPVSGSTTPPTPPVQPQPGSSAPEPSRLDPMSDSSFLQRLILWSGATALVLLLGVFLTNKSVFLGQKAAQSTAGNPAPLVDDQPSATPPSGASTAPEAATPEALLGGSKVLLSAMSASALSDAINQAAKVPEADPMYKTAQTDIERWSQMILDIAEGRAQQKDWQGAVNAAKLIPNQNEAVYQQAQGEIETWNQELAKLKDSQAILSQAKGVIKAGQASSYSDAIAIAEKISPDQAGYQDAQKLMNQWSNEIWKIAQSRAQKKQYRDAIAAAQLVPQNTPSYETAQKAIAQWKKQAK